MRIFVFLASLLFLVSPAIAEINVVKTGGTGENPVMTATVRLQEALQNPISISLGRGRTITTRVEKSGSMLNFMVQFRNSHRSRGWTLQNDIKLFDRNGRELLDIRHHGGLRPKGFGSTKVRNFPPQAVNDQHGQVAYIVIVAKRNPSKRYEEIEQRVKLAAGKAAAAYFGVPVPF